MQNACGSLRAALTTPAMGRSGETVLKKCSLTKTLRMMKLLSFLLFVACLQVSADGLAQKINLTGKNLPVRKVLKEIGKQSGLDVIFTNDIIDKTPPISIHLKDATVEYALQQTLRGTSFRYEIMEAVIVIKPATTTPSSTTPAGMMIRITGVVLGKDKQPLAGATIRVKGKNTSTISDERGNFEINAEPGNVLVISYIGYSVKQVIIKNEVPIQVEMTLAGQYADTVEVTANTGYQKVRPNEITGALSVIDHKTLNQQVGTKILERLDGVSSILFDNKQLTAGKRLNISVRGLSTINGPQDPIIVLDGYIYQGDINNINPNLIENVTVLKDAAAASIWGARAGNGVIVITTKRGNFNQKMQIGFNANVIVAEKPDLFYLPQMASGDYIDVEQLLYNKGYFNNKFTASHRPSVSPAVEIFRKRSLGQISAEDSTAQINALKQIDGRDQYLKYFYQPSVTQQYSLDLSGGTSNAAYTLAVAYDHETSRLAEEFKKINVRMEMIFKPVKNLQATISAYYTDGDRISGRPVFNFIRVDNRQVPYLKFADDAGNPLPVDVSLRGIYSDTAGGGKLLNWKYYPLEDYKHSTTTNATQQVFSRISLKYDFLRFFNVELNYQVEKQQVDNILLRDIESYYTRDMINNFTQLNGNTIKYNVPMGGIRQANIEKLTSQTGRAQLNFFPFWGRNSITGILGAEFREVAGTSDSYTAYGYNEDPLSAGIVDFVNTYRTYVTGVSKVIPGAPFFTAINQRYISYLTSIAYSFDKKYTLSVSARRDGSNVLGASTNDKWKPLWSTGLSWKVSRENFYKAEFLPQLQFRVTFGYTGNVDPTKSAVPIQSYTALNPFNGFPKGRISTVNDPELRWETVGQWNFGADFSSKNQVITGSFDYFIKKGTDLYGPAPYDYTTWGISSTISRNVANMEAKGFDLTLNSKNLTGQFNWTTTLILSNVKSITTDYFDEDAGRTTRQLGDGNEINPVIGKPLYSIAAYKWGGLDQNGNPQGYVNGALSTDYDAILAEARTKGENGNMVSKGSALPTTYGSLINSFSWKGLSLSFNLAYKMGYYFQRSTINYFGLVNGIGHSDYAKRWQKPGDENITYVPTFVYPVPPSRDAFYTSADIHVFRGDHVRLKYINLSYSINDGWWKKLSLKGVQLYFNAANLGILWRANDAQLDPESPYSIPPVRTYAFGIRAGW